MAMISCRLWDGLELANYSRLAWFYVVVVAVVFHYSCRCILLLCSVNFTQRRFGSRSHCEEVCPVRHHGDPLVPEISPRGRKPLTFPAAPLSVQLSDCGVITQLPALCSGPVLTKPGFQTTGKAVFRLSRRLFA